MARNYYNTSPTILAAMAVALVAQGFTATVRIISECDEVTHGPSYLVTNASHHAISMARREAL